MISNRKTLTELYAEKRLLEDVLNRIMFFLASGVSHEYVHDAEDVRERVYFMRDDDVPRARRTTKALREQIDEIITEIKNREMLGV